MKLKMKVGDEAVTYAQSKNFQERWIFLYSQCPWATACQHSDFVLPWYDIYKEQYLPVVVFAEAEDNNLVGLLTLALFKRGKKLTAAGDKQAEYQCWLALPSINHVFIEEALRVIHFNFSGVDLCLRYLPPATPIDWLLSRFNHLRRLKAHPRPLMKIDKSEMTQQMHKKNNRKNMNRLKKHGDLQFEHVIDHSKFISLFDKICLQYDSRQAAIHGMKPFQSDPLKKRFHMELHKRGLLHTTILWVGDEIAASNSGLISRGCIHYGINTHSDCYSEHSPGSLHLVMLGAYLAQEDIPMFDLTPGGDLYKERFANDHDEVYELNVYSSLKARLTSEARYAIRQHLKSSFLSIGVTPAKLRMIWRRLKRQLARLMLCKISA